VKRREEQGQSWGTFADWTSSVQTAFLAKGYNDGAHRSVRFDYYTRNAYAKGWRPGASDSPAFWTDLDAAVTKAHAAGFRHFLTISNVRGKGLPAPYLGDGDFIDGTAADAAARRTHIEDVHHAMAAHLVATFPDMHFAYECGNEITLCTDATSRTSLAKYMELYKHMKAGLVAGDAGCDYSPGSTLHVKTNLSGLVAGSNKFLVPYKNTIDRLWGPTDQVTDMFDAAVVGSGFTLDVIGATFIAVHPYCAEKGPFAVWNTPRGAIGPDVPINGLREMKYIAQVLAAHSMPIPLWATEIGFPTARAWTDLIGQTLLPGTAVFDPPGHASSFVSWQRGTLWTCTTAHTVTTSNRPGQPGGTMWKKFAVAGDSPYNGFEGPGIINEELEAALAWNLTLQMWFGDIDDADGVNIGKLVRPGSAPSFIYAFVPADVDPAVTGWKYGLLRGDGVTPKGTTTNSPYLAFVSNGAKDDSRLSAVPDPPTNVAAVAGNAEALVTWDAPADDGGTPVVQYLITASDASTLITTDASTAITYTGLANGTAYTFTVQAINAAGISSASSASSAVTPSSGDTAPPTTTSTAIHSRPTSPATAPVATPGHHRRRRSPSNGK
jgi:hypothetical protein